MINTKFVINFLILIFFSFSTIAQRGITGDEVFSHRFPENVESISNSTLLISNETDHDIIALIRGQENEYLRHVYIRTEENWVFENMPITRFYVQFKAKEFYFEDLKRTVVNFGEKHSFYFYYDPQQEEDYKKITEEEFFKW
ncbi:MAG: hypothetical protein CMD32_02660 [Flavobacteriales bacterium]|jgi:hypothetical protein|nr:hypothetical protein [Flavobacteriales bacterium]|tara:strand:- start:17701 stop:18126 length:426 start_codon:yes stop_codon:yes gene_type:complete